MDARWILLLSLLVSEIPVWAKHAPISVNRQMATVVADSLEKIAGKNKTVPDKYKLSFYYALHFFPELCEKKISVRERKIKTTMAARPAIGSVLVRSKAQRHYVVYVNTDTTGKPPVFDEFTFNAQIGVFAHELTHFLKYIRQGFFPLLGDAFRYRKDDFKIVYERATDSLTILRGFGWQCYDFANQLQNNRRISSTYKEQKAKSYFTPRQIYALMKDLGYDM